MQPSRRSVGFERRRINAPVPLTLLVVDTVMTPRLFVISSRSVTFRLTCCCRTVSGTGPMVSDMLLQMLESWAP